MVDGLHSNIHQELLKCISMAIAEQRGEEKEKETLTRNQPALGDIMQWESLRKSVTGGETIQCLGICCYQTSNA